MNPTVTNVIAQEHVRDLHEQASRIRRARPPRRADGRGAAALVRRALVAVRDAVRPAFVPDARCETCTGTAV